MAAPPRPYRFAMNALPWDVLFHIMLHAEIPDILSLRRTCRIFRDVSHSKAIWRHQLEQDVSLPVPASVLCDLSDATLDAASLERTATASLRMTGSLLQRAALPEPHRIIHDAFTYTNMFAKLLPGGRYLVTGSLDSPGLSTASYVSLWDLDTAIEKAEPIASVRFEMPVIKCTFSTTKERDVIRLLVSSGHRFFGFEVHIIEVRWAPVPGEAPSFTKIATLPDIPVSPISLALDGDVAFFTTPQPVIVWNWRNDAMAAGMNVEGSHARGLVQRYPHVIRQQTIEGPLTPYVLPTPSVRPSSDSVGDPTVSRIFFVFPLKHTGPLLYTLSPALDAAPIDGWWPTSVSSTIEMVTANAATSNEGTGGTDLNFYNWVPATGFTSPNDDAAKDPRYSSASVPPPPAYSPNPPPPATLEPASSSSSDTTVVPDEAIVPPKNNDEDHKNEEAPQVPTEAPAPVAAQPNPRSDPTPSKITHLATTNVPELERLSDVFVHNIAHTHHSRNFFVACQPVIHTPPDTQLPSLLSSSSSEASSQPPADEAVLMSSNLDNFSVPSTTPQDVTIPIRVVKKDGGVMSNDIRMVDLEARNDIGGLARRWKKSDTMMFDPWSGRIVAVTANDIIVWQF